MTPKENAKRQELLARIMELTREEKLELAQELERRAQVSGSEKLKRDRLYRLSDDGELVEVEDDEEVPLSDIHR